jgi:hypothetical protein
MPVNLGEATEAQASSIDAMWIICGATTCRASPAYRMGG